VSLLARVGSRAAHGVIPEVAPETEAPERLVKVECIWAIAEHAAREGGAAVHVRADDHLADVPVASDGMLCRIQHTYSYKHCKARHFLFFVFQESRPYFFKNGIK